MIELEGEKKRQAPLVSIKVIGIGGAGGNMVNSMMESNGQEIEFIVANTDAQALNSSNVHNNIHNIQLGVKSTKGLGTGADPELGKRAAEEDLEKIMECLSAADIVFLVGGLGGGTGSGGLPIVARALREKGILTIAIVTKPFMLEGKRRTKASDAALELLRKEIDTLIVIPNQKLLEVVDQHVSMIDSFAIINDVLNRSLKGIADIIAKPGHINVDFADVRTIMKDMGLAVMGTGKGSGDDRARSAAQSAICSPLLENMNIEGARSVLFNITGGNNLSLHEINEAASIIYEQADEDANIILGSVIDETLNDEVVVTVIATGFGLHKAKEESISRNNAEFNTAKSVSVKATVKDAEFDATDHEKPEKKEEPAEESLRETKESSSKQEPEQEKKQYVLDVENLDVPTFMRQKNSEQ